MSLRVLLRDLFFEGVIIGRFGWHFLNHQLKWDKLWKDHSASVTKEANHVVVQ